MKEATLDLFSPLPHPGHLCGLFHYLRLPSAAPQTPHIAIFQGGGQAEIQVRLSPCRVSLWPRVLCNLFSPHRNLTTRVSLCPHYRGETSKWCDDFPPVKQLIIGRGRIPTLVFLTRKLSLLPLHWSFQKLCSKKPHSLHTLC